MPLVISLPKPIETVAMGKGDVAGVRTEGGLKGEAGEVSAWNGLGVNRCLCYGIGARLNRGVHLGSVWFWTRIWIWIKIKIWIGALERGASMLPGCILKYSVGCAKMEQLNESHRAGESGSFF